MQNLVYTKEDLKITHSILAALEDFIAKRHTNRWDNDECKAIRATSEMLEELINKNQSIIITLP